MTQKIAIGAGLKQTLVAFSAAFSQREGDGAVRMARLYFLDQIAQQQVRIKGVFSSLQHEAAESQRVPGFCAGQDFLRVSR